jgi:hypothetical protein
MEGLLRTARSSSNRFNVVDLGLLMDLHHANIIVMKVNHRHSVEALLRDAS